MATCFLRSAFHYEKNIIIQKKSTTASQFCYLIHNGFTWCQIEILDLFDCWQDESLNLFVGTEWIKLLFWPFVLHQSITLPLCPAFTYLLRCGKWDISNTYWQNTAPFQYFTEGLFTAAVHCGPVAQCDPLTAQFGCLFSPNGWCALICYSNKHSHSDRCMWQIHTDIWYVCYTFVRC